MRKGSDLSLELCSSKPIKRPVGGFAEEIDARLAHLR